MPVQQQMSSFAKKMGQRVAQANVEHKDKPIDTGNQRLPPGIRNGVAKLSTMYTKEYEDEKNGPGTKGQIFFRASAVVMSPESINGQKIAGALTSMVIPLCDIPAKGQRKAASFTDNWFEFQNLFKLLGIVPPNETPQTDPTGQKTEAYYFAAMKTLTDAKRPVYIAFSTRGWTPPPSPQKPKPEEMVFETWHGLAQWNGQADPGAGVKEISPSTQPGPMEAPPTPQTAIQGAAAPPSNYDRNDGPGPQYQPGGDPDPADVVAALVETAMNDPEGATEEGAAASAKLEEMAWANGWTKDQTASPPAPFSNDWIGVGDMALTPPGSSQPTQTTPSTTNTPTVGSKWKFAKRTKEGERLKNSKGEVFPPQAVEIATVNEGNKTCTLKSMKDGKDVVDIKTKKPIDVHFEWLEPA